MKYNIILTGRPGSLSVAKVGILLAGKDSDRTDRFLRKAENLNIQVPIAKHQMTTEKAYYILLYEINDSNLRD